MKQLKTWFYAILLLIGLALTKTSTAQKGISCDSAKVLTYPINTTVTSYTNDVYWFKVTLNTGNYNIKLTNYPGIGKITKAQVYTGSCSSLTITSTDSLANPTDTTFNINIHSTVNGTVFYVKLYNRGGAVTFGEEQPVYVFITGQAGFCPGQEVVLNTVVVNMNGTPSYTWQPGGSNASSITLTPSSTVSPTTYTLTYNDIGGTKTRTISIFPLSPDHCKDCEQVQNGHFEWFSYTPGLSINTSNANYWYAPTAGSSDYYNSQYPAFNGSSTYSVPVNGYTSNTPTHSGNAYTGLFTYFANPNPLNYREYIQSALTCSLAAGQVYNVSFYTILSDIMGLATNNIGAYLSTSVLSNTTVVPLGVTPQINSTSIIPYSSSWTQISGNHIGNGEQYISIGNFYNDGSTTTAASTSTNVVSNFSTQSYYFVDDVSVTPVPPTLSYSCAVSGYSLVASGAATNHTRWIDGINTYSGTVVAIPIPTTAVTYTCIVDLPCANCSDITQTITVNAAPNVAVNNATICSGNTATLTASGANTYVWNPGALTGTSVTVSPTGTTIYTVIGTSSLTGCSNTKTVSVTVTPNPTVAVNNATICLGTSTVLTASGATTYSWNTGVTTNTLSVSPSSTTVYTVTGTTNGCSNTKTVSVTIKSTPTVAVNNVTICPAAFATLTASGANTYSWNTGPTTNTISVTPTVTTTYTVTGTSTLTGCSNTKTVTVTVNPPLVVTTSTTICSGQSRTLTASGASTYSWSTSATTSSIIVTPSVTTTYTVSGTTGSCTATRTVQVTVAGQYCCQSASFSIGTATANTNYSNTSNGAGAVVDVLGTITFTANSTMTNYILRMAPTASININTGVTVTFSNCTIYSCTDLWGGIFINDGIGVPGIVNVTNSRIEDMFMGIRHSGVNGSSSGSTNFINVSNSVLNNNYIAIQLVNYPRAHASAFRQGLSVTGSTITSQYSTTSPQNTLKSSSTYTYAYNNINNTSVPYINFPRGIAGVYLYNLEEIPVILGDSTGTGGTNRFENLDFGVYAENASIKAFNNHFINLAGSSKQGSVQTLPPGPVEIGIGINAVITSTSNPYWVRIGKVAGTTTPSNGNPFPAGNKFEDCGKGIAITNYKDPFVKGNVFTSTNTSVPPTITASELYSYYKAQSAVYIKEIKSNATVTYNYVLNHGTGIYTSHNINTAFALPNFVKVENNLVEAPGTNGFCRQAIQVEQPASTTNLGTGLLTVKNNTIQNVYRGVLASNVKAGLQINDNPTISIDVAKMYGITGTSQTQINNYERTGIRLNSCVDGVVANNPNITGVGTIAAATYSVVRGIWINASGGTNAQVNCNTISNVGRCMQFSSTSLNKVAKNIMNGTYQGFVLSNNGQIGPQGTSAIITNDNEWNGFTGGAAQYAQTYTENSNTANTGSIFYVKPGSPYQPTQNYSNNGNPYITLSGFGIDVQSAGISGESCLALRMMGGDNSNTSNGSNAMRMASDVDTTNAAVFEALASDTTFYDVYQNETQYRNKQLVYQLINTQSIDTTNTLSDFYTANQNSNYQTLITISEALANADYQTAQNINSSLTANNTIEEYQKRINELLLKYINYQSQSVDSNTTPFTNKPPVFDAVELAELSAIANSCFDKYGSVITQARVLINNVSHTLVEFENNCNSELNKRIGNSQTTKSSSVVNAKVYPNPNNGNMTLEYDLGVETNAKIRIFDINGKLISSYSLNESIGKLNINNETLTNGVYYYNILINEKIYSTNKIIIIK